MARKQKKEIPQDFLEYKQKWENGQISLRQAAAFLDMSHTTFYRLCKREQMENSKNVKTGRLINTRKTFVVKTSRLFDTSCDIIQIGIFI